MIRRLWRSIGAGFDQPTVRPALGHQPFDPDAEEGDDVIERDVEMAFLHCRVDDLTAELQKYREVGPMALDVADLLDRVARAEDANAKLLDDLAEVTAERDRLKKRRGQPDPAVLLERIDQLQRDNAALRLPDGAPALYLLERARADGLQARLDTAHWADMARDRRW